MKATFRYGVAALALTIGMGMSGINAVAQTSSGGTDATDAANSGMQSSGSMSGSDTTTAGSGSAMTLDKASFAAQAESSNMFEIESSKLALKQAKSSQVKNFAEQMIKDHTKAGKRMEQTLKKEGMKPAKALTAKHEALLQQLEGTSGAEFDAAYVTAQTQAHMEAVSLFRSYASDPDDKALGAFAKKTLPTLQKHLEHVQKLEQAQ